MRCSLYDPAGGAYAFSYIGYNGTMAGGGDTEDTRWDDALKYRLTYGPVHFGAMYKFADGLAAATPPPQPGLPPPVRRNRRITTPMDSTSAETYGKFSADVVFQHYNQAISVLNPLLGPQSLSQPYQSTTNSINTNPITGANLIGTNNTVYGIVTDNNAIMVAAKYTWDRSSSLPATNTSGRTTREPVGRWRLGPGRLYHERRRRQQS
jgi:predicted porin